ncbi:hypothetical protein [Weissella cibaria]|uniref:hypothetical protein n=1 Tax=Weissella cibaria TaxID=137591 RepID=UPI001899261E|nr:hypothetical protein [Weissella cibaria]
MNNDQLMNLAKPLVAQQDVEKKSDQKLSEILGHIDNINIKNSDQNNELDNLELQLQALLGDVKQTTETEDNNLAVMALEDLLLETDKIEVEQVEILDTVLTDEREDWTTFKQRYEEYAQRQNLAINEDPFTQLMTESQKIAFQERIQEEFGLNKVPIMDKYDYFLGAFSGVITGLIDILFVGNVLNGGGSPLREWTDKSTDKVVENFGHFVSKYAPKGKITPSDSLTGVEKWIDYLERRFNVPYDARYGTDLVGGKNVSMDTKDHHLKSLAHSPDIIGLFFSILDQFNGTTSLIDGGRLITLKTNTKKAKNFELQGHNVVTKLICGVVNWFGHLMSDIAGSSGAKGRGAGIPAPFYSLIQNMNFGETDLSKDSSRNFAEFSEILFTEGYDLRAVTTQAMPVALNELLTRFFWAVKRVFYHKENMADLLKNGRTPELRRMLLTSYGTFVTIDGIDATGRAFIKGGAPQNPKFWVALFGTLNLVGWSRFGMIAFQEVYVKLNPDAVDVVRMDGEINREWSRLYSSKL